MKSIQTKIIGLIMMVVVLCSGVIGGIGIWHIKNVSEQNAAQIMNLHCREEGKRIEQLFHSVEQSVKIIAQNSVTYQNMETILESDILRETLLERLKPILLASANSTAGAVAVYVHFNPEIAPSDLGLFYSKAYPNESFRIQKVTDLAEITPEKKSTADWYYKPVESGEPVWLEPYYNGKISKKVISYVVPIYQDKLLVGVAGMDILFSDITDPIGEVKVYDSGVACLLSEENEILYHPIGEPEYKVQSINAWDNFVKNSVQDGQGKHAFEYYSNGEKHKLTYYKMENGMGLLLTAPTSEIDKENNDLMRAIIASVFLIIGICILVSYVLGQSIIRPLKELTVASQEIAEGNLKITLPTASQDEVGLLAVSLQQMIDRLSVYMDRISDLAYTDPLTGVKSKSAYSEEIRKIERGIEEGISQFGLIIFDMNGLKIMNDTYGHDAGDTYIKRACRLICTVYKHSPVFRIGGDEFAAILMGQDLLNSSHLMHRFYDRMDEVNKEAENPYETVSVAAGMAVFKEGVDIDFQSVFKRADENMYKNKKSMKSGAGPILETETFEV